MQASPSTPALDDNNPWPGLAAYGEDSRRFFHGREADTTELLRLIRLSPFVVLHGKSGLGKSSMLQAGLFPELRAARFLPVYLRLDYSEKAGQPPLEQAAARLRQEIDDPRSSADAPPPEPGESLWAYLQRREWPIWTTDNFKITPVLVFDQFEELFSRGVSPEHVNKVLESLADLVGDRLPAPLSKDREAVRRLNLQSQQYRVVLSFRSDFLAEVEAWEKRANLPRREALHLTAMSPERAVQAVQSAGHAVLAPGVAEKIVDFLLTREGGAKQARATEVEPVLLSLCCYQLNRRRKPQPKIDAALLQAVGADILSGFYKEALEGMDPQVAVFIEENLILGERYRNSFPLDAALGDGKGAGAKLTQKDLDTLTQRRLLRVDPQGGEPRIELIHDRLVDVVRTARDARRALENQQKEHEKAEQRAREERDRARLAQSESERVRESRRRKGLVVAVTLLLALSSGLIYSRHQLSKATQDANARADEFAQARADALAKLAEATQALSEQQKAIDAANSSAAGESPTRAAAAASATAATREVLTSLAAAEQKLQEPKSQPTREEPEKPSQATQPAPPPAKDPVVVAATAPAPAGAPAETSTLTVTNWRLSSGGCLQGEVTVTGEAKFWIEPDGKLVVVREKFVGKSNNGFTVTVEEVRKPQPRVEQGSYVVETKGDWVGPKGRRFSSRGEDRVFVKDGLTPTQARLMKFKTECPG